ncbi:hypothetical protein KQI77_08750 [Clostridium sp. MSJ-8]|uniref:hypothetical protein n=1 Tax=Clostridium sp. MSJ-8 TaxID=2841510 RepID=UPI001C0EF1F3|nr:hypothetical protein [Clostridium sp. MSJ-8]MBU5488221.1 hypothetical protein [Clostridium sp. MSJ-8]
MPTIWNINQNNGLNNRKMSSKLTFSVGEKFAGRLIKNEDSNEVQVKLQDGWQFQAEIEGDYSMQEGALLRFQVLGYENGKLKLKLINNNSDGDNDIESSLNSIIKKEGLTKEDASILREMVEHNIPLTRENITNVKSILDFKDKLNNDPEEANRFIDNYLNSKGISEESSQYTEMKQVLTEFFQEVKNMSSKDIMLFLENNIELSKENIESFNKLFNGELSVKDFLDSIKEELQKAGLLDTSDGSEGVVNKDIIDNMSSNNVNNNLSNMATKVYDMVEANNGKVNVMNLLKLMIDVESGTTKELLSNLLADKVSMFTMGEYNELVNKLNSMSDEEIANLFQDTLKGGELTQEGLEKTLTSLFNKNITLTDVEANQLKDAITNVSNNMQQEFLQKLTDTIKNHSNEINPQELTAMLDKLQNISEKDIIKGNNINETLANLFNKNIKLTDEEINEFNKFFTTQNKVGVENLNGKIINNDQLKGIINSRLAAMNNTEYSAAMNKLSKLTDETFLQSLMSKGALSNNSLSQTFSQLLGKEVQLSNSEFNAIKNLLTHEANSSTINNLKNELLKNVQENNETVRDIIKSITNSNVEAAKLLQLIKANVSDFKLLDTMNNEYYYLNMNLHAYTNEYPCKLIIKDNRKGGKQIDKNNIKMVVSVDTVNLGSVDGYLSIKNSYIDVNIKCNEKMINILSKNKNRLVDGLRTIGLVANVTVTKQEEKVNISNCRDFFSTRNEKLIDRIV